MEDTRVNYTSPVTGDTTEVWQSNVSKYEAEDKKRLAEKQKLNAEIMELDKNR